jgi:hypothetical protein
MAHINSRLANSCRSRANAPTVKAARKKVAARNPIEFRAFVASPAERCAASAITALVAADGKETTNTVATSQIDRLHREKLAALAPVFANKLLIGRRVSRKFSDMIIPPELD